jgi:hypothetical protein
MVITQSDPEAARVESDRVGGRNETETEALATGRGERALRLAGTARQAHAAVLSLLPLGFLRC